MSAGRIEAQQTDPPRSPHYWPLLVTGAVTSILLHESAHVLSSMALGGRPTFGFDDQLRPVIYSGINAQKEPHKQFLFSASGLVVQTLIDEGILDIPHHRGAAFERGLLAGGIGTTVFYLTLGRNANVSDVDNIARAHGMTKMQTTLVFGSIAALHTWRISRDSAYANFFVAPHPAGRLDVGFRIPFR